MKVYNYVCPKCGFKLEDVVIDDEGNIYGTKKPPICPKCNIEMKRVPSFGGSIKINF